MRNKLKLGLLAQLVPPGKSRRGVALAAALLAIVAVAGQQARAQVDPGDPTFTFDDVWGFSYVNTRVGGFTLAQWQTAFGNNTYANNAYNTYKTSSGWYQETALPSAPGGEVITQVFPIDSGAVPGEFVQNSSQSQSLYLQNVWHTPSTLPNGGSVQLASVSTYNSAGNTPYFEYHTAIPAGQGLGAGNVTAFSLTSLGLKNAASFTLTGFLNGNQVASMVVPANSTLTTVYPTGPGWSNIDRVTFQPYAAVTMEDVQIGGIAVPEPTTLIAGALLLLPFGASTLRVLRKGRAA